MSLFSQSLLASDIASILLDVSLKSAAVLALAAIVCAILHRRSAAVRHRIWFSAVIVSLLVPAAALVLPRLSLPILPASFSPSYEPPTVADAPTPTNAIELASMDPVPQFLVPRETENAIPQDKLDSEPRKAEFSVESGVETAIVSDESVETKPQQSNAWPDFLWLGIWMAGVLIVGVPTACLHFLQWLRHRQETPIHDAAWNACVSQHARQLGLSGEIKSYATTRGTVPSVFGVFRPYLVVPEDYHQWGDEMRRCVLLHELAHIKRRDVATQYLGRLATALYWFNPLAWLALRRLRIERELASDDCVLMAGQRPSDYAQQLLNMLRMYRVERLALGVAMTQTPRLDQRVTAVLDPNRSRIPVSRLWANFSGLTAILLAGLLGVVSIATQSVAAKTSQDSAEKESSNSENASPAADSERHAAMKFSGIVLQGQKPVAGATVTLWQRIGHEGFYEGWHPREELDAKPRQVAVSDENGRFEFTFSTKEMKDTPWNLWNNWIKPWHHVQVVVSKKGMGSGWCNLAQLRSREKVWMRGTVPLTGRIIDLEGRPVSGCKVRFYNLSDNQPSYSELWQPTWTSLSKNVVSDEEGRFTMLGLPAGRKKIRLYASGPAIATKIFSVDLDSKEGPPVEVIVEPTKPIEGIVRDRETGEPVSGVVVYGAEDKIHRLVRSVTNDRGEYRLVGLPKSKRHWVTTYSPFSKGYLTRYTSVVDTPGLAPIEHDVQLRKGIPVRLTVIDKQTRERLHPEVHYMPTRDNPLHREAMRQNFYPGDEYRRMHAADETGVVRFVAYPGRGFVDVLLQGAVYLPVGDTKELIENKKVQPLTFAFSSLSAAHGVIHPKPDDEVVDVELVADAGEKLTASLIDEDGKPVVGATVTNRYFNGYMWRHSGGLLDNLTPVTPRDWEIR